VDAEEDDRPFKKTAKQKELLDVANKHAFTMAYGGSRSGKTVAFVRNVFLRAIKRTSNHLICRSCYNHVKTAIGMQTAPFVLEKCFKGLGIKPNKADGYYTVPAADGGESIVWLGGTDDKERLEKLLGFEYSTIYLNECSQIPWDAVPILQTRLAETSGLSLRMYFDANPPNRKHWTFKVFERGLYPDDEPHEWDIGKVLLNPRDNLENLPPEYLRTLERLPKRQRQRFLDGLYLADIEGALWSDQMINMALAREPAPLRKTVVAVDPAVTNNKGSDECGIVICSLDEKKDGVVHEDLSVKTSTRKWARRAVNAYHVYDANCVVAEVNQGGDLVLDALKAVDPNVPVKMVRAAKGKLARAEPISEYYEPDPLTGDTRVTHEKRMPQLESELTETVFDDVQASPNRLDALVWGLTYLMNPKGQIRVNA
jgi:hypothetical protein